MSSRDRARLLAFRTSIRDESPWASHSESARFGGEAGADDRVRRVLSYDVDLAASLGGSTAAFAGFTSGTGGSFADHDIIFWSYSESVPEPTVLGAVCGLGALLLRRGSRK